MLIFDFVFKKKSNHCRFVIKQFSSYYLLYDMHFTFASEQYTDFTIINHEKSLMVFFYDCCVHFQNRFKIIFSVNPYKHIFPNTVINNLIETYESKIEYC